MSVQLFEGFMEEVIRNLERKLKAPEYSLLFLRNADPENPPQAYFCREICFDDEEELNYLIGFRKCPPGESAGSRFLLDVAVKELFLLFSDPVRFRQRGKIQNAPADRWFYDHTCHRWHCSHTLAQVVYEAICQDAFQQISACLNVSLLTVSSIANMAYEKDDAKGCIVFYSGPPEKLTYSTHAYPCGKISFCEENRRFIRKQFAGAGDDGLLFISEGTGSDQAYIYHGYLAEASLKNAFIEARLHGKGIWDLYIGGRPLFRVKSRDLFMLDDPLAPVIKDIITEFGFGTAAELTPALRALAEQGHGTSIIILDTQDKASQDMLERLKESGRALRIEDIRIAPFPASKDEADSLCKLLKNISRVDGALICDYREKCIRYVNVIVDGLALLTDQTFYAFGSRHNALFTAIANLVDQDETGKIKAAAVIFSEDGDVSCVSASYCRAILRGSAGTDHERS